MRGNQRQFIALGLLTLISCSGEPPARPVEELDVPRVTSTREGVTRGGLFFVRWWPDPDPLPVNAPFGVSVVVARADTPDRSDPDALLQINAFMPAHNHGMRRVPEVTRDTEGTFNVTGMLFHMPGRWELVVRAFSGDLMDETVFPIDID